MQTSSNAGAFATLGAKQRFRNRRIPFHVSHAEILLMIELYINQVSLDGLSILVTEKPCNVCSGTRGGLPRGQRGSLIGELGRLSGCETVFRGEVAPGLWRLDFSSQPLPSAH